MGLTTTNGEESVELERGLTRVHTARLGHVTHVTTAILHLPISNIEIPIVLQVPQNPNSVPEGYRTPV